jgi:hypothetical protein
MVLAGFIKVMRGKGASQDRDRRVLPLNASWNVLGYGNNGAEEHAILVHIL